MHHWHGLMDLKTGIILKLSGLVHKKIVKNYEAMQSISQDFRTDYSFILSILKMIDSIATKMQ